MRIAFLVFLMVISGWAGSTLGYAAGGTTTLQAGVSVARGGHGIVGLDLRIPPRGYPKVATVFPGTPASQAGLQPGDLLVEVDGTDLFGLSKQAVDQAMSDQPGDEFTLTIARGTRIISGKRIRVAALSELPATIRGLFATAP